MERLTFEGNFCDIAQCRELPCPYNGACSQRKVWERLKAYEDTGLEPAEVHSIVNAAPTVDAEVVVRCKDCKHYDLDVCLKIYSDGNAHIEAWQPRRPEDFCSYGERKDDEHEH